MSRIESGRPVYDIDRLVQWAKTLRIPDELLWFDLNDTVKRRDFLGLSASAMIFPGSEPDGGIEGFRTPMSRGRIFDNSRSVLSPEITYAQSWATPICNAVIDPTDAARRVLAGLDSEAQANLNGTRKFYEESKGAAHSLLASDFAGLAGSLPYLIGGIEFVSHQLPDHDYVKLQSVLSDVYSVAGWTLIKADNAATAWIAAQKAVHIAERLNDSLRSAAAMRCLSEVYMRAGDFEAANRLALLSVVHLDMDSSIDARAASCLRGAALLSASAAAARMGDGSGAYVTLKAAAACAQEFQNEHCDFVTVFGPTNVAIHMVANAVELGNPHEAMDNLQNVKLSALPERLTERRARYLIDAARAHAMAKDDCAALAILIEAEGIAPDEVRYHRLTRELVQILMRHERRTSELRAFAERCGLLT
jgi:hypothetical protein